MTFLDLDKKEITAIAIAEELAFGYPREAEELIDDYYYDYITINKARNGRFVAWYFDDVNEAAVYVDNLEKLSKEEIEEQLM